MLVITKYRLPILPRIYCRGLWSNTRWSIKFSKCFSSIDVKGLFLADILFPRLSWITFSFNQINCLFARLTSPSQATNSRWIHLDWFIKKPKEKKIKKKEYSTIKFSHNKICPNWVSQQCLGNFSLDFIWQIKLKPTVDLKHLSRDYRNEPWSWQILLLSLLFIFEVPLFRLVLDGHKQRSTIVQSERSM